MATKKSRKMKIIIVSKEWKKMNSTSWAGRLRWGRAMVVDRSSKTVSHGDIDRSDHSLSLFLAQFPNCRSLNFRSTSLDVDVVFRVSKFLEKTQKQQRNWRSKIYMEKKTLCFRTPSLDLFLVALFLSFLYFPFVPCDLQTHRFVENLDSFYRLIIYVHLLLFFFFFLPTQKFSWIIKRERLTNGERKKLKSKKRN